MRTEQCTDKYIITYDLKTWDTREMKVSFKIFSDEWNIYFSGAQTNYHYSFFLTSTYRSTFTSGITHLNTLLNPKNFISGSLCPVVYCTSLSPTILRTRDIEVGLFFFFCKVDRGAELCRKLFVCLGKLHSSIYFLQLSLESRYRLCCLALLLSDCLWSSVSKVIRHEFIFAHCSFQPH